MQFAGVLFSPCDQAKQHGIWPAFPSSLITESKTIPTPLAFPSECKVFLVGTHAPLEYSGACPLLHKPAPPSSSQVYAAAAAAVALWRRVQSFMAVLLDSPLLHSALLALEVEGLLPVHEPSGLCSVKWTLAQMLALYLKSGAPEATEMDLLATLWVLESWGDAQRGPCTLVLQTYLSHLITFDRQRALSMASDWSNQFQSLRCALSASQVLLLKRLGWSVQLDLKCEVAPCRDLLFRSPTSPSTPKHVVQGPRPGQAPFCRGDCSPVHVRTLAPRPSVGSSPPLGCQEVLTAAASFEPVPAVRSMGSSRDAWVNRLDALCVEIDRLAGLGGRRNGASRGVRAGGQVAAGEEEEEEPPTPSPPKRPRGCI